MKTILSIIIYSFLFGFQNSKDSLAIQKYDPKLGLNMTGLIIQPKSQIKITENKIAEIKERVKNYPLEEVNPNDVVFIETSVGKLTLKLFPDVASIHCSNFKKLANSGFYDGTTFHRVIPGFMIQGGDILSRDYDVENDGTGSPGWTIKEEFNNISHKRGILSMARSSDPNSAGSQFFICLADVSHLDSNYTVFGEVISKIHVIDRIAQSPTGYSVAKINSKTEIPKDDNPEDWVILTDPKNGNSIYSKIPEGFNKNSYRTQQQGYLYSDRPLNDVVIKKIRVKPSREK